jgi:hypothetical protein
MRESRQLDNVIEFAEDALRQHPGMSGAELLERLYSLRSSAERLAERATCQYCGYPVYNLGGRWQHEGPSGNVAGWRHGRSHQASDA